LVKKTEGILGIKPLAPYFHGEGFEPVLSIIHEIKGGTIILGWKGKGEL
jgi:hypothetical protein